MYDFNLALLAERIDDPVFQSVAIGLLAAIAIIVLISLLK